MVNTLLKKSKMLFLLFCFGALHSVSMGFPIDTNLTIIGGTPVNITDAPYMAALYASKNLFICGGSVVHERFILTAAHCVSLFKIVNVAVGISNLKEKVDDNEVSKIFRHPNYVFNQTLIDYDVALIKVSKTITFSNKVNKIKLPTHEMNLKQGDILTALGWGETEHGAMSKDLLSVKLPFVPNEICQKDFEYLHQKFTDRMLCAGEDRKGSCHGDSGGPLVHESGVQVGITSWGDPKCHNMSVYANVPALRDWISETIAKN